MTHKKKLIEVALPLVAINAASTRKKSIRHGHPSTLHLWWARRPLAAAHAEIFDGGSFDGRNATIKNHGEKFTLRLLKCLANKGPVTLLCHCAEEQMHCHRHILPKIIGSKKV